MKTIIKTVVSIIFISQSIFLCGQNYYQEHNPSNDLLSLEEAREYGTLNGIIFELGLPNIPLAGGKVEATNTITGDSYSTISGAQGYYEINLSEGVYHVICSADGFIGDTVNNVNIRPSLITTLDFILNEFPFPVTNVIASYYEYMTELKITWEPPLNIDDEPSRAFSHYEIYILTEEIQSDPELWLLLNDTIYDTIYTITEFGNFATGWYLFAVKAIYSFNSSNATFSNTIPIPPLVFDLSISLHCSDGGNTQGTYVFAEYCGHTIEMILDSSGSIIFENFYGSLYLYIYLPGYYPWELSFPFIPPDIIINIMIYPNGLEPPTDLTAEFIECPGEEIELNWEYMINDGFQYFNVYRNDTLIDTTSLKSYVDTIPGYGVYYYKVSAKYDEGESKTCGPVEIIYHDCAPPGNLNAEIIGDDVYLTWEPPGWKNRGITNCPGELLGYNVYLDDAICGFTTELSILFTDLPPGQTYLCVSAVYEYCVSICVCIEIIITHVMEKDFQSDQILIYPNPAKDIIHIHSGYTMNLVSLSDINGQIMYKNRVIGKKLQINTTHYKAGTYLLFIKAGNRRVVRKIVIE